MLIIGLVLSVFGIGFFCWLLFILAVYALPFVAGLTAGLAAFHSGAGVAGAIIVAIIAGGVTLNDRADRLCHDPITPDPRGDRAALCGPGGDRWLQRHARFRPDGHSFRSLARGLRNGRGGRCRRHSLGTDGAVHPTRGGAAHCWRSGYPSAGRCCQTGLIVSLVGDRAGNRWMTGTAA